MQEKFDPFVAEWLSFVRNPNFNLVEKCLKFTQILEQQNLDIEQYIQKISQMGLTLKESTNDVKNPTYLVSILNEFLFENQGPQFMDNITAEIQRVAAGDPRIFINAVRVFPQDNGIRIEIDTQTKQSNVGNLLNVFFNQQSSRATYV